MLSIFTLAAAAFAMGVPLVSAFVTPNVAISSASNYKAGVSFTAAQKISSVRSHLQPAASLSMTAGGKVLVSGFLDAKERTDQFVFDVLHAQGIWTNIVALAPDTALAKKRLISRTARYSGLSGVLIFEEGSATDEGVMKEKLAGVDAWLCFNCAGEHVKQQVELAKGAGVKNLVITTSATVEQARSLGLEDVVKSSGLTYTLLRMGELKDGKEGGPLTTAGLTEELPANEIIREDAMRIAAEAFLMTNATNAAIAIGQGDEAAIEYLKRLRLMGFERRRELDMIIGGGLGQFKAQYEKSKALDERVERIMAGLEKDPELSPPEEPMRTSSDRAALRNRMKADFSGKRVAAESLAVSVLRDMYKAYLVANPKSTVTLEQFKNSGTTWSRAMAQALKKVAPIEAEEWEEPEDMDPGPERDAAMRKKLLRLAQGDGPEAAAARRRLEISDYSVPDVEQDEQDIELARKERTELIERLRYRREVEANLGIVPKGPGFY